MIRNVRKSKKQHEFPSEKEIERISNYFSDPNCQEINIGLMPDASETDKAKYNVCQSISRYKRINNLTPSQLAKKIGINQTKTNDVLFGRLANLNLEELISYTEKLAGHCEVKVCYDNEKIGFQVR
ncbi:XRE family transcriptional regulator [endosymbiont GvMRE of Glomus versiforme]|uniref:XRE family transcriptional regulator n=1 Tax=endosymbiont GvMRE of Glomus versiforme TaxID=2039283 RepID=UPI000EDF2070|nr:XRE family transcriptional regulator [endosymbiont GvMRE of Glomus versiforme]RHZ35985.1 hypothetical protein GvMRE_Ic3g57 [endosymbiont GvMRE of Glomus versiforme]